MIVTLKQPEYLKTADHQFRKIERMKKSGRRRGPFLGPSAQCQADTQLSRPCRIIWCIEGVCSYARVMQDMFRNGV
jgi:hypothetical protein